MNILDLIYPKQCVSCGRLGYYICKKCSSSLVFLSEQICPMCGKKSVDGFTHPKCKTKYSIDGLYSACHYKGSIKDAIRELKYQGVSDIIPLLSKVILENWPKTFPVFDMLVSVPLHSTRKRERGFNQSFILAKQIGKKLNIPVTDKLLMRKVKTIPQADLNREERIKNVKGVFCLYKKIDLTRTTIGLVDDVTTTCSTLRECASVLKKAGASEVWGIVIAHGS